MKIISTKFSGLKVIQSKSYKDNRGLFKEDYKKKFFKNKNFVFGCTSSSKKNVIRGLHLQTKHSQEKYVSVLKGAIIDVAVDLRKKSKTFGKHFKTILSDNNAKSIFLWPPGEKKFNILNKILSDKKFKYAASFLKRKNNFLFYSN